MKNIKIKYSVIILLEEKAPNFSKFMVSIYETLDRKEENFEILIMSIVEETFLKKELSRLTIKKEFIKPYTLNKKTSQAISLKLGFKESHGEIIIVCGSYQQISQESFNNLLDSFTPDTDIISPWRVKRVDPSFNQFQSKVFNLIVQKVTGTTLNDLSCTVKILRREVLDKTEIYGSFYRFLPLIADQYGFKTKEIQCVHHKERGKIGFYHFFEYLLRLVDILTIYFNIKFNRKPLRFFNTIGASVILMGVFIIIYTTFEKLVFGRPIGDRALFLLAFFCVSIGIQISSIGLLGELIAFVHGRKRKQYSIEKKI
ncbi:MAG: glycosyltransferase [Chitinispirillia bacterium]|jgi:hypothetical protein